MTAKDLAEIDSAVGGALPEIYRVTMLAYPFPAESFGDEFMLPNRAPAIIELNTSGVTPAGFARVFFVGSDGGEERYFIDPGAAASPVFAFELETGRHRPFADSWDAYLAAIREVHAEIDQDAVAERARKANRRWWQVWK